MRNAIKVWDNITDENICVLLSHLPEQAMGVQIVDITMKNGTIHKEITVCYGQFYDTTNGEINWGNVTDIKLSKLKEPLVN